MILTIRTDKPEAEVGLYEDDKLLAYEKWQAHRKLAETIHQQIAKVLQSLGVAWAELDGIVVFKGPGSFTGLRIGVSVANSLAYSLEIPITGTTGKDWIRAGLDTLARTKGGKRVLPDYGAPVRITKPQK